MKRMVGILHNTPSDIRIIKNIMQWGSGIYTQLSAVSSLDLKTLLSSLRP